MGKLCVNYPYFEETYADESPTNLFYYPFVENFEQLQTTVILILINSMTTINVISCFLKILNINKKWMICLKNKWRF